MEQRRNYMLPDHHTGEATRNLFDSDEALLVHFVNDETLGFPSDWQVSEGLLVLESAHIEMSTRWMDVLSFTIN